MVIAQREFEEETGLKSTGPFTPLKPIQLGLGAMAGPGDVVGAAEAAGGANVCGAGAGGAAGVADAGGAG